MMLTSDELKTLVPLIDIGIKTLGVQVFQNNGGATLQSIFAKFQAMDDAWKEQQKADAA